MGTVIRRYVIATVSAAFLLLIFLQVTSAKGHCAETVMPSFGNGKTKVRLYTDYFCPPCRQMEPDIEPLLKELVRDRIITLTFVDTPFYRYSSLYVRYFLYAINERKDLEHALYARRSLIEAAKKGLDSAQKLEAFLNEKKITLKPFDPKPVFDSLSRQLKEDGIDATPLCVIESNGITSKYSGAGNITDALTALRPKPSMK
jgi:thiol:disulfide interchange protein DsbA